MIVLIDESGDAGMKFEKGSLPYFVVAAVIFSDNFSAAACDRGIDELRRALKLPVDFEFHFSHTPDRIRRAFLNFVAREEFRYHGFVLNKQRLFGRQFRDRNGFYEFTVGLVCENARALFQDAKVTIDKCGDRTFRQRLEKSLKSRMTNQDGSCLIRKVSMEHSHSNNLIQLADMVCGAVARSFDVSKTKQQCGEFRDLIRWREERVQLWPK